MNHLVPSLHVTAEETEAQVTCSQSHNSIGGTRINVL